MGVLTQRARDKLDTPQWKSLRDLFLQVSKVILQVSPDAQGELAGSYVKFTTGPHPTSAAYAVVWLNMSASNSTRARVQTEPPKVGILENSATHSFIGQDVLGFAGKPRIRCDL